MYSMQELHSCLFSSSADVILSSFTSTFQFILQPVYQLIFFCTSNLNTHQCLALCLVLLVLDIRLNALTFRFLTTSGTHNFAYALLILLQLPLHLLVLILREKNTGSSLLTLTIFGHTLRS